MSVTTHDIEVDGALFIMELRLEEDGTSYIMLTEGCDDDDEDNICDGMRTYDFKEVV